jgi:hypothetical protein
MFGRLGLLFALNLWIFIVKFSHIIKILSFNLFCPQHAQDDPTSCPIGMDAESKKSCCAKLDEKISTVHPYTCCPYPRMVIWKWQYELCFAECDLTAEATKEEIQEKR